MNLRFIDPLVDCVFKAIFGVQANDWMLIDFLNAVLKLPVPITALTIKNPYSSLDFIDDKLTIVDVLAEDALGRSIQVELQLKMHAALAERILYTWANTHKSQLTEGKDYHTLKPTYAIWLMRDRLTTLTSPAAHHCFTVWDRQNNVGLTDQMEIHVIELVKWKVPAALDEESAWLYFFKEAKGWQALPAALQSRPLEAAMTVLRQFSENEAEWHRYQTRVQTQMLQATIEEEHREIREENARLLAERAQIQKDKAKAEQEKAKAEQDKAKAEQDKAQAEQEKAQAEQEKAKAEQDKAQEAQARAKAEQEKAQEHARAERLLAKLRALGLEE